VQFCKIGKTQYSELNFSIAKGVIYLKYEKTQPTTIQLNPHGILFKGGCYHILQRGMFSKMCK
jgi:hypothetical protein